MHTEILTDAQLAVLEHLSAIPTVATYYLAGGTALALRLGHRRSIDFDFFRPEDIDRRPLLAALQSEFQAVELIPTDPTALYVVLQGVTTSFFCYPYPLLERVEPTPWGFGLASNRDIAAMKLEAIAGRGSRKDFIDLWALCRAGLSLDEVFELFDRKFGTDRTSHYHRLRALSYLVDADAEPMPDMLVELDWKQLRVFFKQESARLLKTFAT